MSRLTKAGMDALIKTILRKYNVENNSIAIKIAHDIFNAGNAKDLTIADSTKATDKAIEAISNNINKDEAYNIGMKMVEDMNSPTINTTSPPNIKTSPSTDDTSPSTDDTSHSTDDTSHSTDDTSPPTNVAGKVQDINNITNNQRQNITKPFSNPPSNSKDALDNLNKSIINLETVINNKKK